MPPYEHDKKPQCDGKQRKEYDSVIEKMLNHILIVGYTTIVVIMANAPINIVTMYLFMVKVKFAKAFIPYQFPAVPISLGLYLIALWTATTYQYCSNHY
jgi:hypothetical protein